MGSLFSFSLYSSILLALLYLSYKWVLAGENQHSFNRVALWSIYAVSLLALPVTSYVSGLWVPEPVAIPDIEVGEIMMTVIDDGTADIPVGQPLYLTLLLWIYAAGIAVTLGQTALIAVKLSRIISRGERIEHGPYRIIIIDDDGIAPFSWCRYVVMSRRDWDESGQMILTHELQHLGLRHWIDLLVAQLIGIIQWYNPAAWLMREELKTVHEYQADRAVISSGVGVRDYQMLLIKKAVGARFPSLANSLNHSKLKKRITMMYNQNNSASRRLRALALVPALGIAVAVTNLDAVASVLSDTASAVIIESEEEPQTLTDNLAVSDEAIALEEMMVVADKNTQNSSDEQTSQSAPGAESVAEPVKEEKTPATDANEVYTVVEKKPQFPGGEAAMMKYVGENIRYPENAFKNKVQGRVIVQFVVQKDGKVGEVKILRGTDEELNNEAVRVIKSLPAFTPGEMDGKPVSVWYTFPVMFKIIGEGKIIRLEGDNAGNTSAASTRKSPADSAPADGNQVYTVVEKKPQFPGGEAELLRYISENLRYPEVAKNEKNQGRVVVQFVVKSDGSVGDVKIIRKVSDALDAEAARVIKSLPTFTPGEMGGKPVSVWYTLPVTFKLSKNIEEPGPDKMTEGVTVITKEAKPIAKTEGLRIIGTGTIVKKGNDVRTVRKNEKLIPDDGTTIFLNGERFYGSIADINVSSIKSVTVEKDNPEATRILIETKPVNDGSHTI